MADIRALGSCTPNTVLQYRAALLALSETDGGRTILPPMAVREYDIAFTMGAKGLPPEKKEKYSGKIEVF